MSETVYRVCGVEYTDWVKAAGKVRLVMGTDDYEMEWIDATTNQDAANGRTVRIANITWIEDGKPEDTPR